jgi:hypothetical protein
VILQGTFFSARTVFTVFEVFKEAATEAIPVVNRNGVTPTDNADTCKTHEVPREAIENHANSAFIGLTDEIYRLNRELRLEELGVII